MTVAGVIGANVVYLICVISLENVVNEIEIIFLIINYNKSIIC